MGSDRSRPDSVLQHSVLQHSVLRHSVLRHSVLRHSVLRHSVLRNSVLRNSVLRPATVTLAILLTLGAPGVAAAAADPAAAAFQLYQRGLRAYKKSDYRAAIELFAASIARKEHRNTLYYLGEAYRRLGQLRRAHAYYQRYADKLPPPRRHAYAKKLAKLRVEAPCRVSLAVRPAGAVVIVDGGAARQLPRGGEPLLLELAGGRHVIEVRATGHLAQRRTIEALFGEPQASSVILDPEPRRPVAPPAVGAVAAPPLRQGLASASAPARRPPPVIMALTTPAQRDERRGRARRARRADDMPRENGVADGRGWLVAGLVLGGAAAAALATAVAFNVKHKNEYEGPVADRDEGIAIGAYVGAGVLGAGAITCLVIHALGRRRPTKVVLVPWLLRDGAALGAQIAF